jgi:ribose 1,5-bisphosphate isomerase
MKKGTSRFERILEDIRSIKIQGATNVAKAGIRAYLLQPDKKSAKKIIETRSTEPLLQNALKLLQKSKKPKMVAKKFLSDIKKSHEKIVKKGAGLIKNDMNIFSHCHSSTVIDILKYAKRKRKKKFVVYTTEVEPLLQGRQTAKDLADAGIKVFVFPDLAAEYALIKCDLFLFGVDAFSKRGVANKIGTSMLCKSAKGFKIPRYPCGVSLKFTNKLKMERRKPKEVWGTKEKNIKVINPAFDFTRGKFLSGIISEFGILSPKKFVKKAKEKLKKL